MSIVFAGAVSEARKYSPGYKGGGAKRRGTRRKGYLLPTGVSGSTKTVLGGTIEARRYCFWPILRGNPFLFPYNYEFIDILESTFCNGLLNTINKSRLGWRLR